MGDTKYTATFAETWAVEQSKTLTDIAETGHTKVVDEAKAPTCIATGLTEGSHCSACNEVFVEQIEIDPTGIHEYTVEYLWSGVRSCVANIKCKNCDESTNALSISVTSEVIEGDCQNVSVTVYTAIFSDALKEEYSCLENNEKKVNGRKGDHVWSYTVTADTHSAKCTVEGCGEILEATPHDFNSGNCVCGEGKPITEIPVGVNKYDAETDSGYTVRGNVVTVKYNEACAVGYLKDGVYVAIEAVMNDDGSYSFTAPEGVEEVVVVVIGDIDGDGDVDQIDVDLMAYSQMPEGEALTAEQHFAADINRNGVVNSADRVWLSRSLLDETNEFYRALSW